MGKREKKQRHQRHPRREASQYLEGEEDSFSYENFPSPSKPPLSDEEDEEEEVEEEEQEQEHDGRSPSSLDIPSKFLLYQQSVQSPKGDISYLQKFFLMYVGGRQPLHLQEDFCGTALLSTEWLRSDPRRTAVGLDLDLEALNWCMQNNINTIGADSYSRISLFHGNVLQPFEAMLIHFEPVDCIRTIRLDPSEEGPRIDDQQSSLKVDCISPSHMMSSNISSKQLPGRDIVCAFNYSCCCLHKRKDLVLYFNHVLGFLSRRGGIFVMDLYGGTSSEKKLRLQRRFANFKYVWEQAEFDMIERKTRISLHFHLQKPQKKLPHAFSYSWRLWSLPEIKDCLEEAGFQSVHFWIRQMPDSENIKSVEGFGIGKDVKYEEVKSFEQQDSWNAYIVGVAK
ncbi:uncharacterized protein LOC115756308 [Rhodamnia argentea]|uniref:Uncharacterized protein LOC115756308 n=1 Tax=Rhodamnia argentea TaxID=178133 RepID=A0A8B8R053_9MYRT|nr:uncharacterized protein LOC115756308 [Rhodamnia argentea]XP_030551880.1 uncharacterized protein LOC115756308 [Rhodamnia argentea]XP_030551882.1 uncharacterized protein LOC115756308 [Rhodamnia argentea]